jgi:uncharacterized membrane protein
MSFIRRHAPFTAFFVLTLGTALVLSTFMHAVRAAIAGFDVGASIGMLMLLNRFVQDDARKMRLRAAANDADHHVVIGLMLVIVAVVVAAVWVELTSGTDGLRRDVGLVLSALTLTLAWFFANTLFALHYAHLWYSAGDPDAKGKRTDHGGLDFPGNSPQPDYWDFSYFSFVLAMTFQVSDVQVTSKRMRRLALAHGLIAFFFNITVVALSVNLLADVLK